MLFKELLSILIKMDFYSIRIDTYDTSTNKKIKHIYNMDKIPKEYDNLEVCVIHSNDAFDSTIYQYFVTVYKQNSKMKLYSKQAILNEKIIATTTKRQTEEEAIKDNTFILRHGIKENDLKKATEYFCVWEIDNNTNDIQLISKELF